MIKTSGFVLQQKQILIKTLSTRLVSHVAPSEKPVDNLRETDAWKNAKPFDQIPGPSLLSLVFSLLPGGKYHKMTMIEMIQGERKKYGDLMKLPGLSGNPPVVLSHDPELFKIIFRSEGQWPYRRGLECINYYRAKVRPGLYTKYCGLIQSQGKAWGEFRSAVNPTMIQPKTIKIYIPTIDTVVNDFVDRIRKIRNPTTLEMPPNFEDELNQWALESIGAIAFDTRLGLIGSGSTDSRSKKLISSLKVLFEVPFQLDFKPSPWRYISTPKYRQFVKAMDTFTDMSSSYIEEAEERIKKHPSKPDHEQSVLEKLLKVDRVIAHQMAMDMLMAGVDTTSGTFIYLLLHLAKNPDKQKKLQEEIFSILPEKDTPLTEQNMANMPYLRACFKEAQRLNPILNGTMRKVDRDLISNGYQIPKGTEVAMGAINLQRQDDIFPDAMKFLPERWLKGEAAGGCPSAKTAHPFIFLPFGFGPRMCIGKRFAQMEIEVLTSRLLRNFFVEWNYPDLKSKTLGLNFPSGKFMFKLTDIDKN